MNLPVTRAELKARLEQRFDRIDANHDGTISPQDREARVKQRQDAVFDRIDGNQDGAISRQELADARGKMPMRQGMMRKGMMRRAMMMRGAGGPRPGAGGPPPGGPPRGGPPPMGGRGPGGMRPMMDQAAGPIAKADFVARGLARFDAVDTNHDGVISSAERDAAREMMPNDRRRAMMPPPQPQTVQPGK
jgi:hypothetical protein